MDSSGLRASLPQHLTIEQTPGADRTPVQHPPAGPWRAGAIELPILCIIVGAVLVYGWLQSDEGHLTAETGVGYYLGITGSLLMLALLLYPLRKRLRALRFIGGVRQWFRVHMLLGIIGPAIIVLHSNFTAGSLNSTVALVCMLIVAGSGFIGRFLYARIHRGLYGRKAHVREYLGDASILKSALCADEISAAGIVKTLHDFETRRLRQTPGISVSLWRAMTSGFAGRRARRRLIKATRPMFDQLATQENWTRSTRRARLSTFRSQLDSYFAAVARAEAFVLYERLFSLWHMLHLPLFVILVFAALAHVVAVHLY